MLASLLLAMTVSPPAPCLPVPSKPQIAWHRAEYTAFCHFGPNTFTGEEWGHGTEDPKMFNPVNFDARQWAKAFKDAGMTGIIITAKHHDGFCLWPSKQSKHTVRESGWRNGTGDVLKELSQACKEFKLKFGVYVSPWDRNHPAYGTPEYNRVFAETLKEVLTNYGPIHEVWFDGANGEGPNGRKQIYDWPLFHSIVRKYQPNAVMFSDAGPGVRWVGNEDGYAGETCWAMIQGKRYVPGTPHYKELTEGSENGEDWIPAECDVSIRPGWFWKASQDKEVKSVEKLMDIWYGSVGRNGHLLLNVPPNNKGLISDVDVKRLMEFKAARQQAMPADLGLRQSASSADSRGSGFEVERVCDGKINTYFAAKDDALSAQIMLDFARPTSVNIVSLSEYIPLGQRVKRFEIDAFNGSWKTVARGTTIGNKRILRFAPTEVKRLRVRILDSRACPTISSFEAYSSRP
ncbi:MAG: alpha-L-fucosidase [Fimbriimonadaceae bacterium]